MNIGERIKYYRLRSKMSQEDLAKVIKSTKQAIYKYESGAVTNIPMDKIEQMADAFGISPAHLMGWDLSKHKNHISVMIKQLRGDLSLREFALKCDVSHTTIDNLEKGIDFRTGKPTQVKITTLQKIADACDVPVSYIIGEEDPPSSEDLRVAVFGGGVEVTEEMWQELLRFADYLKTTKMEEKN